MVFIYHVNKEADFCPVIIGELKSKLSNLQSAFDQLLIYQLSRQRPYCIKSDSSQLLGFLMDYTDGYIIELTFGLWTSKKPVMCHRIERYRTKTLEQRIAFFETIFDRLTRGLGGIDLEQLTKPQSPTFRFPPVGTLLDNFTHILKLSASELKRTISPIISSFGKHFEFYFGSANSVEILEADTQLLLKVCGSIISGGIINNTDFARLLSCASGKLDYLKDHYIAVFKVLPCHPYVFVIARYIEGEDCSNPSVAHWWKKNRSLARECFFKDVYQVAMEALRLGYFHWDIRASNIVLNLKDGKAQFFVIDWESVVSLELSGKFAVGTPPLQKFLAKGMYDVRDIVFEFVRRSSAVRATHELSFSMGEGYFNHMVPQTAGEEQYSTGVLYRLGLNVTAPQQSDTAGAQVQTLRQIPCIIILTRNSIELYLAVFKIFNRNR